MANPERGEVELTVGGESYSLKLSTNIAASMQAKHRKSLGQLLREVDDLDVVSTRAILWALLQKHHAGQFKTEEQVGTLMDDAGMKPIIDAIGKVLELNNGPADPNPKAQETTTGDGTSSTSAPDGSA